MTEPLNHHAALIYVMVTMSAVDRTMTDAELARIGEIVDKYGEEVFTQTCEDLMDYAERRMRAELSAFPDGKYGFHDIIENDGIEAPPGVAPG